MIQNLPDWLDYIQTLHPKTIALGLDRVHAVAQRLNIDSFTCPIVTIAGTNGKGSCVAFLEAILQAAGYKVGAYTSPHLLRFNERIRMAGCEATDEAIVQALARIEAAREQISLTYFEFTTLAALLLFKQAELDVLLLEVGLGGRLDAVNIVPADISVLTTLAMDHMDWLGDSREAIAAEKAGIFRAGKPAVCGDFDPPANIYAIAEQLKTPLYCINRDFWYQEQLPIGEGIPGIPTWEWHGAQQHFVDLPVTRLARQNASTALMVIALLEPSLPIGMTAIRQGLVKAQIPGRFQQFHAPVSIILDVAHNPAAAQLLADRLQQEFRTQAGKTLAVVSILADKDISATLKPLVSCIDFWYVSGLNEPRGTSADIMAEHLQNLGVSAYHKAGSILVAFQAAMQDSQSGDRILVFGSFHTVAPVLAYLQEVHYGTQI